MDVLEDVLRSVQLESSLFCRIEFGAPWGVAAANSGRAMFHIVLRGGAWLRLNDGSAPQPLQSGDIVMLPHGAGHCMTDAPTTPTLPFPHRSGRAGEACPTLCLGGGGAPSTILCGWFSVQSPAHHQLIKVLPPVVRIAGERGTVGADFGGLVELLARETASQRPGAALVLRRLTDILFIQIIRAWAEAEQDLPPSRIGALRDPLIGPALTLMHQSPAHPWTVPALAAAVSVSRSLFAARFAALVGQSPLRYLTQWRMQLAAQQLQADELSVAAVAERVGYRSEAAFSRVFRQQFGITPAAYRRSEPSRAARTTAARQRSSPAAQPTSPRSSAASR